ncbi:MAG: FAD-dependent monooxygenase [Rhizomicrobium sp.]
MNSSHHGVRADVYTQVLIVGGGPAGLTASLSLSRLGVPHIVVNRYPSTAHTPRAHIVNQRTLEIMRDLGIEGRILEKAIPNELMTNNIWFMSMAGDEVVRTQAWGGGENHFSAYRLASPSLICNLPQHEFEPLLVDAIEEAAIGEIRFGHEFTRFEQDEDGVTAWVTHRASERTYTIRAKYLIGADGARSRVMEQAGLKLEGSGDLGQICFTWLRADLRRYVEHRPAVLFWRIDFFTAPEEGGSFICVKPWNEWIVSWMIDPSKPFDPNDQATLETRVRSAIGDRTTAVEIINASVWSVNRLYAPEYANGRVMCMGDAVHRHPPTNGLGQNTSIADAFNLAWKLKLVLDGKAAPSLLATYSTERAPIGRQIVERANQTLVEMGTIAAAIGITPGLPLEDRWERIQTLHDATDEARARRRALDEAVELQDFGFNAIGVELGYRYRGGARVDDGTPEPVPAAHPDICYQPTTWPGARLPHAWLELDRRRVSTLDIVGHGRFVLLTGPGGAAPWGEAAEKAKRLTGVEVAVQPIGSAYGGLRDPLGQWAKVREVDDSGAVLVRPDAHIAWRSMTSADSAELPRVMATILGGSQQSLRA